jgi:hypothetical protein
MGHNRNRSQIYIALLAALTAGIALFVLGADLPSTKKQRVVLDALGCQAALQFGVKVTTSDAGICVLEGRVSLTSYWLTVSNAQIDADRVIAVQETD